MRGAVLVLVLAAGCTRHHAGVSYAAGWYDGSLLSRIDLPTRGHAAELKWRGERGRMSGGLATSIVIYLVDKESQDTYKTIGPFARVDLWSSPRFSAYGTLGLGLGVSPRIDADIWDVVFEIGAEIALGADVRFAAFARRRDSTWYIQDEREGLSGSEVGAALDITLHRCP